MVTDNISTLTVTKQPQSINLTGLGVFELRVNERNDFFFKLYSSQHHTMHISIVRDNRTAFRSYFNANRENKIQYFMICEGDIVEVTAYDSDIGFKFMYESE